MNVLERFLAYADEHRRRIRLFAGSLVLLIAWLDWTVVPNLSLGFLYIVPILLACSQLKQWQVLTMGGVCGVLREAFSPDHGGPWAGLRILIDASGFALAGFFVSQLNSKRRLVLKHLEELESQVRLRRAAEEQIRILIETSPLAIVTLNHSGRVILANRSAQGLLGAGDQPLEGTDIRPVLPILGRILKAQQPVDLRTTIECKAQLNNGEFFLAHIWLSTYSTGAGTGLAAVIWDASENLRDREGAGLDSMLATSRVLIGAVSHEIRNLSSAATAAHKELLTSSNGVEPEALAVLGSILQGLVRLSTSGLALSSDQPSAVTELGTVLDETRILIEPGIRELGGTITWRIATGLPLVQADHHGLLQVLLNLARNSQRAICNAPRKEVIIEAAAERDLVIIRFRDTGNGVANPELLFKPFQSSEHSAGLGLYVSRAILRAHGGELKYEEDGNGTCFTVELWPSESRARA